MSGGSDRSSFRAIRDEIARRISNRTWAPGTLIPGEEALAAEFGAARATVNRALQELARAGLIERKRKAGTRVAPNPVREARFVIPIVGDQIKQSGAEYEYRLLDRAIETSSEDVAERLSIAPGTEVLHLKCLHLADGKPYQFENRYINLLTLPHAREQDFSVRGPNEWLVNDAPFSRAEFTFLAAAASEEEARLLNLPLSSPVFVGERRTWLRDNVITFVRMVHPPTHRMTTVI